MGRNNIKIKKLEMLSYKILINGKKLKELINQGILFLESLKEVYLCSNLAILKNIITEYNDTVKCIEDIVGNKNLFSASDTIANNDKFVDFEWKLELSTYDRELIKKINYFSSKDDKKNNQEIITEYSRVSNVLFTLYELKIMLINFISKAQNLIGIN